MSTRPGDNLLAIYSDDSSIVSGTGIGVDNVERNNPIGGVLLPWTKAVRDKLLFWTRESTLDELYYPL
jgi:hypothetical protein